MEKSLKSPVVPDENQTMPRISLILNYESKMKDKTGLVTLLKVHKEEAEKQLLRNYPPEKVAPVISKLTKLITKVQCPTHGKSIGIFVSPVAGKVYYFTPSHLEDYKLPVLVKNPETLSCTDLS